MRNTNESSLKEAIEKMLETYKLKGRLNEVAIARIWEETMGNAIAKRTHRLYVQDKTLRIYLTSASLKNELEYKKDQIKDLINNELGENLIDDVSIF